MANGLTGKRTITVLLVLLALVPTSLSFALNEEKEEKKIEKFIELAERARDKTETLINITSENATAMQAIEDEGLLGEFEDSLTLFDKAAQNVTNAQERLVAGDLEGAIANVTYALEVFRDVFKAIHIILRDSGLAKGELVDAQGLIQAMKRALERIDRLEEIEELPDEAFLLLEEARLYLNITAAIEDLQLGKVNQTAHNKTQANKLIAEAHKALKKTAAEMNTNRIRNYFKIMNNTCERLRRQVGKLQNSEELEEDLDEAQLLINQAKETFDDEGYSDAFKEQLEDARDALEDIEQRLKAQRREEKASGNGKGTGNGKGNGKP